MTDPDEVSSDNLEDVERDDEASLLSDEDLRSFRLKKMGLSV